MEHCYHTLGDIAHYRAQRQRPMSESSDSRHGSGHAKNDAPDPYRPFAAAIDALRKGHSPLILAALDKADFGATGNVE